jgi:hypothetical protein
MGMKPRLIIGIATAAVALAGLAAPAVGAGSRPTVLHQGVVTRQDVASRPGSEPDTVVEPDVAVNPRNEQNAVAAAHDSRYEDGGAVTISVAWTKDAGQHWHHEPVRGVTTATGGSYSRASDPVVAFGPDGSAYLSILAVDIPGCRTAVVVLRSMNGGVTWRKPSVVHRSNTCTYSDDKNWLVVDNGAKSPHRGRVYQFWTPFLFADEAQNQYLGSPQAVRWSDDKGVTWSRTSYVTPRDHGTQNSQPMIRADGSIVDTFYDFGVGGRSPDLVPGGAPESVPRLHAASRSRALVATLIDASGPIIATVSSDGGQTWSTGTEVTNLGGGYADDVRCCLFGADIDAASGRMHVAWLGGVSDTDPVYESFSDDGTQWSSPIPVSRGDVSGIQNVNVDVSARGGMVYVSYGKRRHPEQNGGFVQQQVVVSTDGGREFRAPTPIGPVSELKYAAQADGYFPGDYIGTAISKNRLYIVWAVSSKPPASSNSPYHQVIWGTTLRR